MALLFDGSGSMQVAEKIDSARRAARQVLAWLQAGRDELAIYSFDTALHQLEPFALYREDATLERSLFGIAPFGMTSLNDAIAATAKDVAARPNSHRAVIVLTDGLDNHSQLSPADVSGIASSIDVPVYIMAVVSPLDHAGATTAVNSERPVPIGDLADLARWTGGEFFLTSATAQTGLAARQIVDELRHQYLIAFESASRPGWHPLEVRAKDRQLVVRARGGYMVAQPPAARFGVSQSLVLRRQIMRTFIVALSVAALAAGGTTACATKGFVRNRVGDVNDKVESVSKSLEETQERTRKNEAAIADANQKIVQVDQKAAAANAAATRRRPTRGRPPTARPRRPRRSRWRPSGSSTK